MSEDAKGRFVWYELLTTDPDAAKSFYTKIVGWGTTTWDGGDTPYLMWTAGETPIGGVMKMPPEAVAGGGRPMWLPYVAVPDVEASVKRAESNGAAVFVAPQDIPSVGRFAVLADPQGAQFALFKAEGDVPGHEGPPRLMEFSWHELATTDYKAAFEFYSDLLGWEKTDSMDMGDGNIYQMYGRKGQTLGGMFDRGEEMPGPPMWIIYAHVPDVDALVEPIGKAGGQVVNGPMEVPGGDRIVHCIDPAGAMFALHSSKPE